MNRDQYELQRRDILARLFIENKERMSPEEWKSWMLHIDNVCEQQQKEKKHEPCTTNRDHA